MKKKKQKSLWLRLLDILIVIVFIVCVVLGYQVWQQWSTKHKETQQYEKLVALTKDKKQNYLQVDWEKLRQEAPDVVAWLYVPNTNINYPIVQGSDNDFYLSHAYDKKVDRRGTIFLDSAAKKDFSDKNTLIYAHNGYHGVMTFAELEKFLEQKFFDDNKYLYLLTPQGNYRCPIIAFSKVTTASPLYQTQFSDEQSWQDYLTKLRQEIALYQRPEEIQEATKIITLSTCDETYGIHTKHRYLLQAALEPYTDKIPAP